jgi:hypothetical protein
LPISRQRRAMVNDIDQQRILVEAPVARLAVGEYLLTAEAQPDKVTTRRDGRLHVAQSTGSGVYGVPK